MEDNQGLATLEEDMVELTEVEIQGTIGEVEKDTAIKVTEIATADVVDGNNCKT